MSALPPKADLRACYSRFYANCCIAILLPATNCGYPPHLGMGLMKKIVFADALRGIAALCVLIFHYCGIFWTLWPALTSMASIDPLPAGVTPPVITSFLAEVPSFNLGMFGVGLFFLVSGFVIPYSLVRLNRISFIRARLWRILPTYAVGFAISVAAILLAGQVYQRQFPYSFGEVAAHIVPGVRMLTQTPFIDYIVWTLEIEMCFYAICVIIASWLRRQSLFVLIVPVTLVALAFSPPFNKVYCLALA